uniref:Olfactory receptor 1496-like n=1 Tax=Salarias fasciatus TaxID=181472 RepID=A0A672FNP3_SALFA
MASMSNSSAIIHPPGFYIIGFQTFPNISVYIIFLAVVYMATLVFNAFLMYIIAIDHCLHTPKFLAVFNLALVDIILNTTTIPSMIKVFFVKDNFIPFNLCLVQMYFYYSFVSMESYSLAILAYDRMVAICLPLRQNMLNTVRIILSWSFALGVIAYAVALMTRLSFCSSLEVLSYFCDYAPVFRLACNDYSMQWWVASMLTFMLLVGPFTFIFLSYVSILVTVFKMKSLQSRVKALSTCVEHLILVAIFYIPLIVIFTIGFYMRLIDPDQRVLSLSLASCIPPCINPIVYSLKTKEIKIRVLALMGKNCVEDTLKK